MCRLDRFLRREVRDDHAAGCLAQDEVDGAAEERLLAVDRQPPLLGRSDHDQRGALVDDRVDDRPAGVARAHHHPPELDAVVRRQRPRHLLHLGHLPVALGQLGVQRILHRHVDGADRDHRRARLGRQPAGGRRHLLGQLARFFQRHHDRPAGQLDRLLGRRCARLVTLHQRDARAHAHHRVDAKTGDHPQHPDVAGARMGTQRDHPGGERGDRAGHRRHRDQPAPDPDVATIMNGRGMSGSVIRSHTIDAFASPKAIRMPKL